MMNRPTLLLLVLILGCAACASGTGSALYRRDIGNATAGDATSLARQVINRYGYEIDRLDSIPDIRILTYWRPRSPFADEIALGVSDAESRLLVEARQRGQTELGAFYNVNMTVENRVRLAGSPDWNETLNTEMFRDYANEITNDYRQLVTNIGVRRYGCCRVRSVDLPRAASAEQPNPGPH